MPVSLVRVAPVKSLGFIRARGKLSFVLLLFAGVLAFPASSCSTKNDPPKSLTVADESLDFGTVWETDRFCWTLPIRNSSDEPIEIKDFSKSCTCSSIEPLQLVVPPRETRDVKLTIDLTAEKLKVPESESRDFELIVEPVMDKTVKNRPHFPWRIQGCVKSRVFLHQAALDLGRHSELAQPLATTTASGTAYVPMSDVFATCSTSNFEVQKKPDDRHESWFKLEIQPKARMPIGKFAFYIVVFGELENGEIAWEKKLPVKGEIIADIQARPAAALFGAAPIGETLQERIEVVSLTGRRFEVESEPLLKAEGLIIEQLPNDKFGRTRFDIKQCVLKPGQQTGHVRFHVRGEDKGLETVIVDVSYFGIQAEGN